jgi:hypothetical protein
MSIRYDTWEQEISSIQVDGTVDVVSLPHVFVSENNYFRVTGKLIKNLPNARVHD